ncbi:MAG TPA: hypothetical protein VGL92_18125 [Acidimicrobiia bacterium]
MPAIERAAAVFAGGGSVVALLAWVYGVASFQRAFLAVGVPSLVVLGSLAWRARRSPALADLLAAGAVGGLLGTFAYDLFRIPFVVAGFRVLAPIDSYGVLLLGASESSPWTGGAGWAFHLLNGVGFGIVYAALARRERRHWAWAVAWAMVLETATVVTPFARVYGIAGHADLLLLAFAAHVAYGVPLGLVVARGLPSARTAAGAVAGALVALVAWQHPWSSPAPDRAGRAAAGPSTMVVSDRFRPEWVRIRPGACVTLLRDGSATRELCPAGQPAPRVVRHKVGDKPFSGGFVLIDPYQVGGGAR